MVESIVLDEEYAESLVEQVTVATFGKAPLVIKAGWLRKKGQVVKNWKQRWCILQTNNQLAYFENDKPITKIIKTIDINSSLYVGPSGEDEPLSFAIVTEPRTWIFSAKTSGEFLEWLMALQSIGLQSTADFINDTNDRITWDTYLSDSEDSAKVRHAQVSYTRNSSVTTYFSDDEKGDESVSAPGTPQYKKKKRVGIQRIHTFPIRNLEGSGYQSQSPSGSPTASMRAKTLPPGGLQRGRTATASLSCARCKRIENRIKEQRERYKARITLLEAELTQVKSSYAVQKERLIRLTFSLRRALERSTNLPL